MRILALITARGGSKRLPGKNKRLLGGKPLIVWSIDAAKGIPEICDILVSTDDPETAVISEAAGALVPWLRPAELATDTATSVDVAIHALDWYEKENGLVEGLLLLQPTSPFRSHEQIAAAVNAFAANGHRPIVSVSPAASHPAWCFRIYERRLHPFINMDGTKLRSQELEPAFALNGSIYLIDPNQLREARTFFTEDGEAIVTNQVMASIDIDTEFDWLIAEAIAAARRTR